MARIPVYTSQSAASGHVQTRAPLTGVDPSGLVRGVQDMQTGLERQRAIADHEVKVQEHQREVADKAAAREHFLSMKDTLADEFEAHSQGIADGSLDKTSARTKWAEKSKVLIDLGVEKVPPSQRAQVQSQLMMDAGRFDRLVGRAVAKRDQTDTLGAINSSLEFAARMAERDPEGARVLAMQTLTDYGPAAGLNAAQIQEKANAWKESAAFTKGLGLITRGKLDNGALTKAEETINGMDDLDPQRKVQLLDRAAGYKMANLQHAEMLAQRRERERERQLRTAEHEFNAFQALADKGGALTQEYVDQVVAKTAGTPYQAAVRGTAKQVQEIGGFALRPFSEQNAAIAALDNQIAAGGRNPAIDKRREQLDKVRRQTSADIERDPLAAYAERGGGLPPPVESGSLDTLIQSLPARTEHAAVVARWAGKTVSPLTADEADKVATQLDALPVDQRAARIAALAGSMTPGQAQSLATQIDKKNRGLSLEFAAGAAKTTEGRYTSELIARGRQAIRDKAVKEDSTAMTGLRASLAAEVGDSLTGRARDDTIEAARFITLGKQAAGETVSVPGAIALALGGPLVEHNGKKIPVPAQTDLVRVLEQYPAKAIDSQATDGFVYLPGGRPMGVPEFLAALPAAQLEPAGFGRYFVRSGGSIAYNKDRQPIVVQVR